jgi:hypothetical protein
MKALWYQFAAWCLMVGGALSILFSPWLTVQYQKLALLIGERVVIHLNESELMVRASLLMMVGAVAIMSGLHLRRLEHETF